MSTGRKTFFDHIKALFGGSFKPSQIEGMTAILDEWDKRKPDGDLRWLAYILATAFHETAQQMQPVREAYWLSEDWRKKHLTYYPYYGRGYVQLTHKGNYDKAGQYVQDDLVNHPDRALEADIAAAIMFVGMEEGWFRASGCGKRHDLPRYFTTEINDPVGTRNIINGKEWKKVDEKKVPLAKIIAQYHDTFLDALNELKRPAAVAVAGALAPASATHPSAATAVPAFAAANPTLPGFANRSREVAEAEWVFFGRQTYNIDGKKDHAGHTEGEDGWYQRIGRYWVEGTTTHGIDGRNHAWPWSAAFISWVMKLAGAGNRFRYSTQHSVYISQGIRDFLQKRASAGYRTERLNQAKPAVGDLVCWTREKGVDYDQQKSGNYKGHSDEIVEVQADKAWIIGGNVGNSVTRHPLRLDQNGFLAPAVLNGEILFGNMKCRIP